MAITITTAGSTWDGTSGTHTVTATPAVDDLIVIIVFNCNDGVALGDPTVTDNNSSGTYTKIVGANRSSIFDRITAHVRTAAIGAASSTVFSATAGGASSTGGGLTVLRLAGASGVGAAAIVTSGSQAEATAGTPAPVLGATPSTANAVIAAVANFDDPAGLTPRTGYTEAADVGELFFYGVEVSYRASGETSATITYGSASASDFASIAFEVAAAGAGATSSVRMMMGHGV